MTPAYPATYAVTPAAGPLSGVVAVPGSKSITNRALVLAALSGPGVDHVLTGTLASEDTEVMADCLTRLGFTVTPDWAAGRVSVRNPTGRVIPAATAALEVANSGTTMRFVTAMLALGTGDYRLDGVPRMRERPIADLLDALTQLGVDAVSEAGTGCPPVRVRAGGLRGGTTTVRADVSSQFLSGLLMAATRAAGPVAVALAGPRVSEPYIAMTLAMIRHWGGTVAVTPAGYAVTPGLRSPGDYAVEPDASAASYFWAAAAVTGGRVTVRGLTRASLQGDVAFVDVLGRMGCTVTESGGGITVEGGRLRGIDVDMGPVSDTVMTLAAVACFAEGPTRITNIGHIRHKETDRIAAITTELRKLGAGVDEAVDGLTIHPKPLTGCRVETYRDHRMAMSLALVGLRVPGVVVADPGCVAKTYPGFWVDFEAVR